ncbi:putative disease resistance RPP13-like protein 1 [Neltuma alba]|uniref:putative disease resistance RPP13-like protein 1 n=1 Tax=Neltuma alba TaxID=207710 RepID=UPI0010A31303|nr:putative disease resistance RPP13-like protein 1 [Prosopis alba]
MDLHLLQRHLAEKLERKRFLVVLDDYWNENYTDWVNLKNLLHNGVEGCTILVTTRIEHVALMVKTISSFYHLNALSDRDCLSIFAAHAFSFRDSVVKSCLEKIGKDVVTKCKGLPLAAKVLGGLFRSKCDFDDWNNILEDAMWDSLDNEIIPALKVSYYYLPPHLKQCFAYCSLFPEGYVFDKEELILMWMAEGFLQPSKRNITLEEVGYGYLDDLTSRSFFQSLPESYVYVAHGCNKSDRCFVMHDLIHALATHVAGDFYFRLGENRNEIGTMTRHLSCDFQNCHCLDRGVFQKSKGLRTFIGLNFSYILKTVENASHILSSNLKHLRTLSLRELSTLKTVPESIGKFVHLRYLDLSGTSIVNLPNSICRLYNLQTLKLCYCSFLMILPSDMQDLVNLRYLDLSSSSSIAGLPHSLCKLYNLQTLRLNHCRSLEMLPSDMQYLVTLRHLDVRNTKLKEMPRGLGKLKDLQFLSDFIVGKEQETGIGELGGISKLKGWIAVSNLENVKNENEASDARMMEKKQIKNLTLSWSDLGDVEDTRTEKDVLAHLQPHWDLEELEIICYRGTIFSDWLGSPSYHKMTSLRLENCTNCCMLPSLGQLPALKKLYIIRLESVVSVGDEFLKGDNCASMIPFPSLEYLHFSRMASWEQWHSINTEAFPKLQLLTVSFCNKLAGSLPLQLLSLETLEIKFCSLFSSCIPKCPKLQNLHAFKSGNMMT